MKSLNSECLDVLRECLHRVLSDRSSFAKRKRGLGSFVVGDYLIAYRVDGDNVLILRVLRGSRDIEALSRD